MDWLWLMIILDEHGLCSSSARMSHSKSSLYFVKEFKTKKKGINVASIRNNRRVEFENEKRFLKNMVIFIIFHVQKTSQQNGVVERKNKPLQEMERTMWNDFNSPKFLMNYRRVDNPTYHTFIILDDNLGKFNPKSDKGTFLGYSNAVYKSRTLTIEESIHVNDSFSYLNLEDLQMLSKESCLDEDPKEDKSKPTSRNWQIKTYHPKQQILGNVQDKVKTRSTFKDQAQASCAFHFENKCHGLVSSSL
ncbi:hypothetical protein CR513_36723, partial [Mucuna pruriens]